MSSLGRHTFSVWEKIFMNKQIDDIIAPYHETQPDGYYRGDGKAESAV